MKKWTSFAGKPMLDALQKSTEQSVFVCLSQEKLLMNWVYSTT